MTRCRITGMSLRIILIFLIFFGYSWKKSLLSFFLRFIPIYIFFFLHVVVVLFHPRIYNSVRKIGVFVCSESQICISKPGKMNNVCGKFPSSLGIPCRFNFRGLYFSPPFYSVRYCTAKRIPLPLPIWSHFFTLVPLSWSPRPIFYGQNFRVTFFHLIDVNFVHNYV